MKRTHAGTYGGSRKERKADLDSAPTQGGVHTYGSVDVSKYAQAHLGDKIIHYHFDESPPQEVYDILLESLTFEQMDGRVRNIAAALPTTCEWIRSREEFRIWSERYNITENRGILWIKGKPGSGKSTVMKETLQWATHTWAAQITLSYFFNARATQDLEKSCIGLYRCLLHQLLGNSRGIRSSFTKEFASKLRKGKVDSWTEIELQNFLIKLVSENALTRLNVFVDALDEGNEDDVRSMVEFFEEISIRAVSVGVMFRLCLSSRHYPHISPGGALSITLEYQVEHTKAIQSYIHSKLRGKEGQMKDKLEHVLLQKAAGVFLWVVLVLPVLNQIHDRGRGMISMMEKLDSIPQTLHDLFVSLLNKDLDTSEECSVLLRLVLHSVRPLNPVELYSLVQHTCGTGTVDDTIQWSHNQDAQAFLATQGEFVLRWITDCSRGLVEVVERRTRVQFIHEIVQVSLTTMNLGLSYRSLAQASTTNFFNFKPSISHTLIAEACIVYFLDACHDLSLNAGQKSFRGLHRAFPSAVYAANHWWQHAKSARVTPRLLELVMKLICDRGALVMWAMYYDANRQEEFGYRNGSVKHPLRSSDLQRTQNHAVEASIRTFGSPGTPIYPSSEEPMYYAALIGIPDLVGRMLLGGHTADASGRHYNSALQAACAHGHTEIVRKLLAAGANVDKKGDASGSALTSATSAGHIEIVQILLEAGAKIEAVDTIGGNALHAAAASGNVEIFHLLLNKCRQMRPSPSTIDLVLCAICEMSDILGYAKSAELFDQIMRDVFPKASIALTVEAFHAQWLKEQIWPDTQSQSIRRLVNDQSQARRLSEKTKGLQYLVIPRALENCVCVSDYSARGYIERYDLREHRNEFLYRLTRPAEDIRGPPPPPAPSPMWGTPPILSLDDGSLDDECVTP